MTRLHRERLARGLTLRELASEVGGVTYSGLAYLERGQVKNPRPGLRLRLERYFRLPVEVLLMDEPENANSGPKPAAQVATENAANPGAAEDKERCDGS
jgi:transcriptional regulator with XRE-family HTH domain